MATEFIDCTSLSLQYDTMGLVTLSLTIVSDEKGLKTINELTLGENGRVFTGYLINASGNRIPGSSSWYESHIVLIGTIN